MAVEHPWPAEPVPAKLGWPDGAPWGWLHFIAPDGDRAAIPVHLGASVDDGAAGRPIWHIESGADPASSIRWGPGTVVTVDPSIDNEPAWHSPKPVQFRLVDELQEPG